MKMKFFQNSKHDLETFWIEPLLTETGKYKIIIIIINKPILGSRIITHPLLIYFRIIITNTYNRSTWLLLNGRSNLAGVQVEIA